jgi:hypothetical protein
MMLKYKNNYMSKRLIGLLAQILLDKDISGVPPLSLFLKINSNQLESK